MDTQRLYIDILLIIQLEETEQQTSNQFSLLLSLWGIFDTSSFHLVTKCIFCRDIDWWRIPSAQRPAAPSMTLSDMLPRLNMNYQLFLPHWVASQAQNMPGIVKEWNLTSIRFQMRVNEKSHQTHLSCYVVEEFSTSSIPHEAISLGCKLNNRRAS